MPAKRNRSNLAAEALAAAHFLGPILHDWDLISFRGNRQELSAAHETGFALPQSTHTLGPTAQGDR